MYKRQAPYKVPTVPIENPKTPCKVSPKYPVPIENSKTTKTPITKTTKPNVWWWIVIMSIIVIGLGVLLHYTYEWSGENGFVGTFSSVNESVWEHLKLLFYPLIIACLIQFAFLRQNNLGPGIMFGVISGMLLIVAMFYTYIGAFTHPDSYVAIDITIFIISSILAVIVATAFFSVNSYDTSYQILSFIVVLMILILFIVFTFNPPDVPLFVPPPESN